MSVPRNINRDIQRQARRVLYTGNRFNQFEQIRERHFWSTGAFATDANGYVQSTVRQLFHTPSGQTGQGFTGALGIRETNWDSANRVPDNQNFEIKEIGVTPFLVRSDGTDREYSAPSAEDMAQILDNTVVAIRYLTNTIELGLAKDFAQPSAPYVGNYRPYAGDAIVGAENRTTGGAVSNGFPAPALRRRFKIPILLQHGEAFSFQFIVKRTYFANDVAASTDEAFALRLDFWAVESFVERS